MAPTFNKTRIYLNRVHSGNTPRNNITHKTCLCQTLKVDRAQCTTVRSWVRSKEQEIRDILGLQNQLLEATKRKQVLQKEECDKTSKGRHLKNTLHSLEQEFQMEAGKVDNARNELKSKRLQIIELEGQERDIFNQITDLKGKIRVGLRIRSLLRDEELNETMNNLSLVESGLCLGNKLIPGEFACLWTPGIGQDTVFRDIEDFIRSALNGYNVSVLFYGESGSGKTYTMLGGQEGDEGMLPRALRFLFEAQKSLASTGWRFSSAVSSYEIYNEKFVDLLNGKAVCAPRFLHGLLDCSCFRKVPISTVEEGMDVIQAVITYRTAASTGLNWASSRSHCIFYLEITAENGAQGITRSSVLMFVDLAGSERIEKSLSKGPRLIEAKCINQSLLSLRIVIRDQLQEEQVVRYRDSKLTMALSGCLGAADSKTLLIVTLSPSRESANESIRSIFFASEASVTNIGPARPMQN